MDNGVSGEVPGPLKHVSSARSRDLMGRLASFEKGNKRPRAEERNYVRHSSGSTLDDTVLRLQQKDW